MAVLDIPRYRTRPLPERYIFTNLSIILLIVVALYMIVYANYWLLERNVPLLINILFMTFSSLIIIISAIASYIKYSQYSYIIYTEHIEIMEVKKYSIKLSDISQMNHENNILDRIFRTETIKLVMNDKRIVTLRHIQDGNQVYFMLQKMISR